MRDKQPRFPNKFVVIGVATVLCGLLLLLWTLGDLGQPVHLWPLGLVIAGLVFLYLRIFRRGPDSYVFIGTVGLLSGVLLLVTTLVVPLELAVIWPFFMTICGVALITYGMRKRGYTRISLTIPGVAALLLSFIFFPFSLGIIKRPFAEVVAEWWPLILILGGVGLLVIHWVQRSSGRRTSEDAGVEEE